MDVELFDQFLATEERLGFLASGWFSTQEVQKRAAYIVVILEILTQTQKDLNLKSVYSHLLSFNRNLPICGSIFFFLLLFFR